MTAQELGALLMKSSKGITWDRLEKLKGAVARENQKGHMITFEQVIAHLPIDVQHTVAKVLAEKGQ